MYRQDTTTDLLRLCLLCIIHPLVHEFTMTIQRIQSARSYLLEKTIDDPKRVHFAAAALAVAHLLEAVFATCK